MHQRLVHENIVRLIDHDVDSDRHIVMSKSIDSEYSSLSEKLIIITLQDFFFQRGKRENYEGNIFGLEKNYLKPSK